MNGSVLNFTTKLGDLAGLKVLEVGSMDVNGSPRQNFPLAAEYVGVDFRAGAGVDVVMDAKDIADKWPAGYFDAVICCETLEHCEDWKAVLTAFWKVLKVGGVACITTPTKGKKRHNHPDDYWRFELSEYKKVFTAQNLRKATDVWAYGVGVIVEKVSDDLDLDIQPYRVP